MNMWGVLGAVVACLGISQCDHTHNVPVQEVLRFATSGEYSPFEFYEKGELVGFDIELGHLIAQKLGKKAIFENMEFNAIFPALGSGFVDAGLSAITMTPERRKEFSFSIPYYSGRLALVFLKEKGEGKVPDVKEALVGCQLGSTMEAWAKKNVPSQRLRVMNDTTHILESLKAGHIDAALMEDVGAQVVSLKNPELAFHVIGRSGEDTAVIFPKNSPLLPEVNTALRSLIKEGELDRLYEKWIKGNLNGSQKGDYGGLWSALISIGKGGAITLLLLLSSLSVGIVFGTILTLLRYKKIACWVWDRLISFIRGTPMILQLSMVYFLFPRLTGVKIGVLPAGIITFGLNSSAYIAEILKAGIKSVPRGQFQAAQTLEIPFYFMWRDIIFPQVLRHIFPALISEVISLLKETALIATLGGMDIMRQSQLWAAQECSYFLPLSIAAFYYYALVLCVEYVGRILTKRRSFHD